MSFGQFIANVEDGKVHDDLTKALSKIAKHLDHYTQTNGGKAKGKLVLTLDFTANEGIYEIKADISEKLPKEPRSRTILWSTPDHNFSPANPKQMTFFGPRAAGDERSSEAARSV